MTTAIALVAFVLFMSAILNCVGLAFLVQGLKIVNEILDKKRGV